jgi:hypothetical protein
LIPAELLAIRETAGWGSWIQTGTYPSTQTSTFINRAAAQGESAEISRKKVCAKGLLVFLPVLSDKINMMEHQL